MRALALPALLVLGCGSPARQNASVTGFLTDAYSGQPLVGARACLGIGSHCDYTRDGTGYHLEPVPDRFDLTLSDSGHLESIVTVVTQPGENRHDDHLWPATLLTAAKAAGLPVNPAGSSSVLELVIVDLSSRPLAGASAYLSDMPGVRRRRGLADRDYAALRAM